MRYRKDEAREQIHQRQRKEQDNVALLVISKILKSKHMKETFQEALECHRSEDRRPVTLQDYTRLRDVLILKLMIVSLKRAMEFCEFTMGEYAAIERKREADAEGECYVIRITNHKTAVQGNP